MNKGLLQQRLAILAAHPELNGILLDSQATLNELEGDDFHCALCHVDDPTHLDDRVGVAFFINPALEEPDINPFRDVASYWRFFMSRDFIRSKQLTSYVDEVSRANELIEPDGSCYIAFEAEPAKPPDESRESSCSF